MTIWQKTFGDRRVIFDGGMGTLLQSMGLKGGERPEGWNLTHPDKVQSIHAAYLDAGAEIITANTFGATRAHLGGDAAAAMTAGIRLAKAAVKEAGRGMAAIDMSSLGRLPEPYGDMPFEEAVRQFREAFVTGIQAGGDLVLIETMTDLLEVKAAVLAAKEAFAETGVTLPLLTSLTFDLQGRLLSGADIPGAAAMLEGLRVDGVGLNCGHSPEALLANGLALLENCRLPVFISPNASLPVIENGQTVFPTSPAQFAADMLAFARAGARGLGGCCGTTPEHIRRLTEALRQNELTTVREETAFNAQKRASVCVISGRAQSLRLGERPVIIGERLNPTGKKLMKQALRDKDMDYLRREAVAQTEAGADVLDVNVGLPEIDEPAMLKAAVQTVQTVCDLPLQLDTSEPAALEAAIRGYAGKPLINSVSGKQAVMDAVFPIAQKYSGAVVALLLDDEGIPQTVEGRVAIAQTIIKEAERYGIPRSELIFDALTMPVATDQQAAAVTLDTIRVLHDQLKVKTVLGVSNVSFGLPQRPLLTAAFIAMAVREGLDAAIMNPNEPVAMTLFTSAAAIAGKDSAFAGYIERYGSLPAPLTLAHADALRPETANAAGAASAPAGSASASAPLSADPLYQAILHGVAGDAATAVTAALQARQDPLALIEASMMPALGEVGERYEKGRLFLPQLLQSASAAQAAFDRLRAALPEGKADEHKKVILATVKGDVHDIGKNIVKVLLQNYGFTVLDLGKDVPPEAVLSAVRESAVKVVGLSALMTTTVPAMRDTISLLHREAPDVKIAVGGAVLNETYAQQIEADRYCKDAMATVRLFQQWCG